MIPLTCGTYSSQILRERNQNGGLNQELGGVRNGKFLFNGYRVVVLQAEKSSADQLHNNMIIINTSELYT